MKPSQEPDVLGQFETGLRYVGAFAASAVVAVIPVLLGGHWPDSSQLAAAVGAGLLGTGLFHIIPPRGQNT